MKLTAKLVAAIVVGIAILFGVETAFTLSRAETMYEDTRRDSILMGRLLGTFVADEWRRHGMEQALQAMEELNRQVARVHFRWVWLSDQAGDPFKPRLPLDQLQPAVGGQPVSGRWAERDGRYLLTYVPLQVETDAPAALEIAESLAPLDAYARTIKQRTVVLAGSLVLLGAAVTVTLGFGMVGRPLQRIANKVRRIGAGDLGGPLRLKGHDELAELATSINTMCDHLAAANADARAQAEARIQTLEQLRHADRLSTVGLLASGVAHELGSPLNVIAGRADMIARSAAPEAARENAAIIKAQADRVAQTVRQLLAFARRETPHKTSVNVVGVINDTVRLLASLARKRGTEVRVRELTPLPEVSADPGHLQQVFTNLLLNAIQAMPRGGEVEFTVQAEPEPPGSANGRHLRVDVQDQGPGIAAEHLERIFDPFFTTKDVGEGTGLGLAIAYGIVKEHGGRIEVASPPGRGACFSVVLPLETRPCPDES